MARSGVVTTDMWKGQLNFDRACTSTGVGDRCWLIADLVAWNRVLHGLECALVEIFPGKLSLRHLPHDDMNEPSIDSTLKAAFLISWLVEHHGCIDELFLWCTSCPDSDTPDEPLVPIRLRPPLGKGIRSIEIHMSDVHVPCRPSHYYLLNEDIEALRGVQELKTFSCDAKLVPALARLVEHNSNSIKVFEAIDSKLSRRMVDSLQRLEKCESITIGLRESDDDSYSETDAVTRLVQSMAGVNRLSIFLPGNSDCNISGLAHAVETSLTLSVLELAMFNDRSSPRELFAALAVNSSVKIARVHFTSLDISCAEALAVALSKNSCLLNLNLHGTVTDHCMIRMAAALTENTTLAELQFSAAVEGVSGVMALCEVLRTNKTLKKLEFPVFDASQEERVALAKTLADADGYNRVLLPLAEPDLPILSTLLTRVTSCPQELDQVPICSVSDANLRLLLDALSSSTSRVQMLSVSISEDPGARIKALGLMLKMNRSIKRFYIIMHSDNGQFVEELLEDLEVNKSISDLGISAGAMRMETVAALSDFLARNRTINKLRLSIIPMEVNQFQQILAPDTFAEVMSRGLVMNPVLVEFDGEAGCKLTRSCYPIFETLRRNAAALNRAVDFSLGHAEDRVGAQAFEVFFGRPCLVEQVMGASGQTEHEALQTIAAAHNFLLDNYFIITGVVQHTVTCHRADSSAVQCDELNADCWRAILRYLKVSDVLS